MTKEAKREALLSCSSANLSMLIPSLAFVFSWGKATQRESENIIGGIGLSGGFTRKIAGVFLYIINN